MKLNFSDMPDDQVGTHTHTVHGTAHTDNGWFENENEEVDDGEEGEEDDGEGEEAKNGSSIIISDQLIARIRKISKRLIKW